MIAETPVRTSEPVAFAKLDDAGLVSAIHDGYDEAFEVFYSRYHGEVLSFCRHMLGVREDAEDVVQQTFLATYRQSRASSPPSHPRAWLYTVARNRCITTLRARRETPTDTLEPATEGLAEEVERRHELRQMLGDLGRLPEDQRVALLLFEVGSLSQGEIAETIGCEPKKVKALVYQARTTLAHRAEAREARCTEIRQQLATLRGGSLNSRAFKHHLEICAGCAEYRDEVRRQRRRFAVILPVIPLAGAKGGVLAGLGLANGASHAAAGSNGAVAHSLATGASHAMPGRLARVAGHATRPRAAVLGALTAGAAVSLVMITGGQGHHGVEPVVPPAEAAASQAANKPIAAPAHRAVHRRHVSRAARQAPLQSTRSGAARGLNPAPQDRKPMTVAPAPAPTPKADPKPNPKRPAGRTAPNTPSPGSAPVTTKPPSEPTGSTPPPRSPTPACGPRGQGQGNAWGLCKGPDGLPPPAEQHSQGNGPPGGTGHGPGK